MSLDWSQDWSRVRYELAIGFGMPRKVTKPKADLHAHMAEHWCGHVRSLGRPGYHEARGFTRDRWMLAGGKTEPWQKSISGHEAPYGYGSRALWRYVWFAMREAFLAEWHRALGTTYETTEGGRRSMIAITGLTS